MNGVFTEHSKEDFKALSNNDLWKKNFITSTVVDVPANLAHLRNKESCYVDFHKPMPDNVKLHCYEEYLDAN
jgi:hypothetical protein